MDPLSESRPGSAQFPRKIVLPILTICALLAGLVAFGFYYLAIDQYKSNRLAEKATVLSLVDAFFSTYADARSKSEQSSLPVPATFRAHALESFNRNRKGDDAIRVTMVGFPGREIRTAAKDENMRVTMRAFAEQSTRDPVVALIQLNGEPVLRTIRPSVASRESCVACHNNSAHSSVLIPHFSHYCSNNIICFKSFFCKNRNFKGFYNILNNRNLVIQFLFFLFTRGFVLFVHLVSKRWS